MNTITGKLAIMQRAFAEYRAVACVFGGLKLASHQQFTSMNRLYASKEESSKERRQSRQAVRSAMTKEADATRQLLRGVKIFDASGALIGTMPLHIAREKAANQGMSLIREGNMAYKMMPKEEARELFKHQQEERKERRKAELLSSPKTVQFSPQIEDHDYSTKLKQITDALKEGKSIEVVLRPTEKQRATAASNAEKFAALCSAMQKRLSGDVATVAVVEQSNSSASRMQILLRPRSGNIQEQQTEPKN